MRILLVYLTLPPPDLPKSEMSFGNLDREVNTRVTLRTESDHVGECEAHLSPVPRLVDVDQADAGFDCRAVAGLVVVDK